MKRTARFLNICIQCSAISLKASANWMSIQSAGGLSGHGSIKHMKRTAVAVTERASGELNSQSCLSGVLKT